MTEAVSLVEGFALLILVSPGFITFRLITWRASYEFVFSDLQTILWSLIFSVFTFIPFALIFKLESISDLEVLILQPTITILYLGAAAVIGVGLGEIMHLKRRHVISGSVWRNFSYENIGDWVRVYTSSGEVYQGWLKKISSYETHKRELELGAPELLTTSPKGVWKGVGKSILFTEGDILRIILRK